MLFYLAICAGFILGIWLLAKGYHLYKMSYKREGFDPVSVIEKGEAEFGEMSDYALEEHRRKLEKKTEYLKAQKEYANVVREYSMSTTTQKLELINRFKTTMQLQLATELHNEYLILANSNRNMEVMAKIKLFESLPPGQTMELHLENLRTQLLNEQELLKEQRSAENIIRLGIISDYLEEYQKIILIQEQLDTMYKEVAELEREGGPVNQRRIEAREATIKAVERDKYEREAGLVQAYNGGKNNRALP